MISGKVNGGKRPGAGRPKGSVNRDRAEQRHIAEQLLEEGLTPLDIMKARMLQRPLRSGMLVTDDQFTVACALAPYMHPKLTAMAVRDMTQDSGVAHIEDSTPSIRLLLQQALGGQDSEPFPKERRGGPGLLSQANNGQSLSKR